MSIDDEVTSLAERLEKEKKKKKQKAKVPAAKEEKPVASSEVSEPHTTSPSTVLTNGHHPAYTTNICSCVGHTLGLAHAQVQEAEAR